MFGSKIDLFKREWLDVVFAKKTKTTELTSFVDASAANTTKAYLLHRQYLFWCL